MKKIFALIIIAMAFQVNAQNYVSTETQKRNVIIEEFTGRSCPNCPAGHMVAYNLVHNNPGRIWSVNIHAGNYAMPTYPNFITNDGNTIWGGFDVTGYPTAVVNRMTSYSISRDQWHLHADEQMSQNAECNIGGQVRIDPVTRVANIDVEVYYTASSSSNTNYLTIMMLQDSIWGSQSGGENNPMQYVNGSYCHMHVLRDVITSAWGDAISPTTNGTLITKSYEYSIPEVIGSSNGADVVLENLHFIAFVSKEYQGTPTMPILNVGELYTFQGTDQDVYPTIIEVTTSSKFSCSNEKTVSVKVNNGGLDPITSLVFKTKVGNATAVEHTWQGNIPSYQTINIDLDVEVPEGTHNVNVEIVKANGMNFSSEGSIQLINEGWEEIEISSAEEEITIEIMQDKYGNQITWELTSSNGDILASGGPYAFLSGSSATQLNEEKVTVTAGDCIKFVINDANGNGICCQFGEGYYRIVGANDDVLLDGDGSFGSKAEHIMSVMSNGVATETIETEICEGDSYTDYGFNIVDAEAGIYEEENLVGNTLYILHLTVIPKPDVVITGDNEISQGESTTLIASGADTYLWSTGETTASIIVSPEQTTTYSVVGTKDGCEGETEIVVNVNVGVLEDMVSETKIYPNPTCGELKIECDGMKRIEVFMPNGQTIEDVEVDTDSFDLDMKDYRSGLYYLRITSYEGTKVYKTVKQ